MRYPHTEGGAFFLYRCSRGGLLKIFNLTMKIKLGNRMQVLTTERTNKVQE